MSRAASVAQVAGALRDLARVKDLFERCWARAQEFVTRFNLVHASMSLELCPSTWGVSGEVRLHVHLALESEARTTIRHQRDVQMEGLFPFKSTRDQVSVTGP